MKVYVVTTGCYSDYSIDRIFTNKKKAEEYKEWLFDANDIEEYEVDDELEFNKLYKIYIQLRVYDNGIEKMYYSINKTIDKGYKYTHFKDYHKYGVDFIEITLLRYISNENFNEEFYKNKYTKAIYDILAIVKNYLTAGYSEREINELLNNIESK